MSLVYYRSSSSIPMYNLTYLLASNVLREVWITTSRNTSNSRNTHHISVEYHCMVRFLNYLPIKTLDMGLILKRLEVMVQVGFDKQQIIRISQTHDTWKLHIQMIKWLAYRLMARITDNTYVQKIVCHLIFYYLSI